jgi:hypothetical protein
VTSFAPIEDKATEVRPLKLTGAVSHSSLHTKSLPFYSQGVVHHMILYKSPIPASKCLRE